MNKIYVYCRTSTEEQNPENQKKDILSLVPNDTDYIMVMEQQSAWKDKDRLHFDKIYADIKKANVSHLYVWDLDRIYRNRQKIVSFMQLCKAYGTKVHSYRQSWLEDLNKVPHPWNEIMSDLLIQVMGWMAEDESTKKSERVKSAVRTRNGKTFSYKGNRWGRKPLPKQTKDRIIELHKQGDSIRTISDKIVTWVNGNEKKISKSVVHKIIAEYKASKQRNEAVSI